MQASETSSERKNTCDNGWVPFSGHCYYFNETEATWDEAVAQCEQRDSYLIELNSDLESTWITESFLLPVSGVEAICPHFFSCSVWVGARCELPPDKFLWNQSGTEIVFPQWAANQPNSGRGVPACVVLQRAGTGNDMYCTKTFQFICEKE
ncbi:C-type lectin domain family 17, member A-like [Saccostrea echinata]|uniref:C-type lectin domain family 17, member A-like n=1 Tax=Saccostrea echinata TaxID=191078 RepID=UPI002A80C6A9|nr:C-type lectin domain family 17, member A-like [Saccostrea echinata]